MQLVALFSTPNQPRGSYESETKLVTSIWESDSLRRRKNDAFKVQIEF